MVTLLATPRPSPAEVRRHAARVEQLGVLRALLSAPDPDPNALAGVVSAATRNLSADEVRQAARSVAELLSGTSGDGNGNGRK